MFLTLHDQTNFTFPQNGIYLQKLAHLLKMLMTLTQTWSTNKHHLAAMNLSTHGNEVYGHANVHLISLESNKLNSELIRLNQTGLNSSRQ